MRRVRALVLTGLLGTACITAPRSPAEPPPSEPDPTPLERAPTANSAVAKNEQGSRELLTGEDIAPVIAASGSRLRKECWQPALDARSPDAPTSVRVLVQLKIDPSGQVAAADADGTPPGYPLLATCILAVVRSLTFRSARGSTLVNVPYVFGAP